MNLTMDDIKEWNFEWFRNKFWTFSKVSLHSWLIKWKTPQKGTSEYYDIHTRNMKVIDWNSTHFCKREKGWKKVLNLIQINLVISLWKRYDQPWLVLTMISHLIMNYSVTFWLASNCNYEHHKISSRPWMIICHSPGGQLLFENNRKTRDHAPNNRIWELSGENAPCPPPCFLRAWNMMVPQLWAGERSAKSAEEYFLSHYNHACRKWGERAPPNNPKIKLFTAWSLVFLLFSNNSCPPGEWQMIIQGLDEILWCS